MITPELMRAILNQYPLPLHGIHGIAHWARVLENGQRLAAITGAKLMVVELFAVFHDSQRRNEHRDPGHGRRGAELAALFRSSHYEIGDEDFTLLYTACERHTDGLTKADVTVQTCWDSDRLDLGRVRISPIPERMCTGAAKTKEIISWANRRSAKNALPDWVATEWGIRL